MRRLSGRPVLVVEQAELVAYGAAVQAGALLAGSTLTDVAHAWGGRRGLLLEPVERDEETVARIAWWRGFVLASLETGELPPAP